MRKTLNLIGAVLVGSMATLAAADDEAGKKEKPGRKGAAKGLMSADKDKDGKISLDEYKAWSAAKKKPVEGEKAAKLFKRRDKNGDGSLTQDELKGARAGKKKGGEDSGKKKGEGKKRKKDAA